MAERPLRIAVWHNLPTGGARRALFDHVTGLVARGHHVELFRPQVPNPEWLAMPCPEHVLPQRQYGDESSYFKRVLKHVMRPTLAMNAMIDHSQEVAARVNHEKFDVFFANTCCQYHSPFVGRYVKGPKVLYLQEPNRFLYEAHPRLPWLGPEPGVSWRRKLRSLFDQLALKRQAEAELANAKTFDRILVNSYFSHESVSRVYGLESSVCYLGVDTDKFSPLPLPRERFVLGVGAIATPKRVDLIVEAMGRISDPKPKLILAGNYSDEGYLDVIRRAATRLGVDLEFRFLVSDEELLGLIRTTQCLVYVPRLEPFGYVPVEAAACGTPVVTVREGGLRESMEGIGVMVDGTPAAVATGISAVLADPEIFATTTSSHRNAIVEKWGLSSAIDRLESHLVEVASSNR
ncbi:MAG TPA: glycosyltransferase family 4 protein [Fimbriimonas sp.]|nr:glycosyltransferase family 4 protein [Fimbriimonas sp.]